MINRTFLTVLLLACGGCAGDGWQHPWTKANPATIVRLGPFEYFNSKDVNLTCEEFEGEDKAGRSIRLKGFQLTTSASGPRTADVMQTQAITELTATVLAPVHKALELAAPIVEARLNRPKTPDVVLDAVKERVVDEIRSAPLGGAATPK